MFGLNSKWSRVVYDAILGGLFMGVLISVICIFSIIFSVERVKTTAESNRADIIVNQKAIEHLDSMSAAWKKKRDSAAASNMRIMLTNQDTLKSLLREILKNQKVK